MPGTLLECLRADEVAGPADPIMKVVRENIARSKVLILNPPAGFLNLREGSLGSLIALAISKVRGTSKSAATLYQNL